MDLILSPEEIKKQLSKRTPLVGQKRILFKIEIKATRTENG